MVERLTPEAYEHTKTKLLDLQQRLAALEKRTDLPPLHWAEGRRSYLRMISQLRAELELYEAAHPVAVNL